MIGYPDDAYFFADESFFSAMIRFEQDQQLREELNDDTAEWNGYDPDDLDTDDLETLSDFGTL